MKKKWMDILVLYPMVIAIGVVTIIDWHNGNIRAKHTELIQDALVESKVFVKANTADTINKIEMEMWRIADFRLDRLDSVNNLPH